MYNWNNSAIILIISNYFVLNCLFCIVLGIFSPHFRRFYNDLNYHHSTYSTYILPLFHLIYINVLFSLLLLNVVYTILRFTYYEVLPFILSNLFRKEVEEHNLHRWGSHVIDPSEELIGVTNVLLRWYKLFRQTTPVKTPSDIGICKPSLTGLFLLYTIYVLYTLCILFKLCQLYIL